MTCGWKSCSTYCSSCCAYISYRAVMRKPHLSLSCRQAAAGRASEGWAVGEGSMRKQAGEEERVSDQGSVSRELGRHSGQAPKVTMRMRTCWQRLRSRSAIMSPSLLRAREGVRLASGAAK